MVGFSSTLELLLCWRGWWDGVSPVPSHLPQKTCCPSLWLTEPRTGQLMPQPRQTGREDMSNHTNDFFLHFFPLSGLFSFVILEFIFLFFCFYSKALFIYLMYTAKLGEKGVVTWDYLFFFFFLICGMLTVLYIHLE